MHHLRRTMTTIPIYSDPDDDDDDEPFNGDVTLFGAMILIAAMVRMGGKDDDKEDADGGSDCDKYGWRIGVNRERTCK